MAVLISRVFSRSFVRLLALATVAINTAYAAVYEAENGILSGTTTGNTLLASREPDMLRVLAMQPIRLRSL